MVGVNCILKRKGEREPDMYRVGEKVPQTKGKLHVNAYSGEEFHNLKEGPGGCQML